MRDDAVPPQTRVISSAGRGSPTEYAVLNEDQAKHVLRDIREMIDTIGSPNLDSKQWF